MKYRHAHAHAVAGAHGCSVALRISLRAPNMSLDMCKCHRPIASPLHGYLLAAPWPAGRVPASGQTPALPVQAPQRQRGQCPPPPTDTEHHLHRRRGRARGAARRATFSLLSRRVREGAQTFTHAHTLAPACRGSACASTHRPSRTLPRSTMRLLRWQHAARSKAKASE